jgi:hypothetical protein
METEVDERSKKVSFSSREMKVSFPQLCILLSFTASAALIWLPLSENVCVCVCAREKKDHAKIKIVCDSSSFPSRTHTHTQFSNKFTSPLVQKYNYKSVSEASCIDLY